MSHPKIGNLAPAFSLQNQHDETVSLKDFKGKKNVVLYFYPKALTPGCTTQACALRDSMQVFTDLDTVILGVSPDSPSKLTKFIQKHDLNFDLLSDENHAIAEKYGVWALKQFMGKEFMGIVRTTFVINKEGRLVYTMDKVNTKTHDQELVKILQSGI